MSHIVFQTGTIIPSSWLNDVDTVTYTYFGNGTSLNNPSKLTVASVVTPLVTSSGAILQLITGGTANTLIGGGSGNWTFNGVTGALTPTAGSDNVFTAGAPALRILTGFFSNIDSGIAGALNLRLNNGETLVQLNRFATITTFLDVSGPGTASIILRPNGSDSNATMDIRSKGTSGISFSTDGQVTAPIQFGITHTAGSTRFITVTGSNGGNPTIGVTGGDLQVQAGVNFSPQALLNIGGASAGQILFPTVQNASASVNTLDDYKEGTWTPTLGGSATYSTNGGTFTKIGRLVFVQGTIVVATIGTGSTSVISGLPFPASAGGGATYLTIGDMSGSVTAIVSIVGRVLTTSITLLSRTAAASGDGINNIFQNGTGVSFSGVYQAAT